MKKTIRLWKLGDHKECIIPSQDALDQFTKILEKGFKDDKHDVDIVWDSLVSVKIIEIDESKNIADVISQPKMTNRYNSTK